MTLLQRRLRMLLAFLAGTALIACHPLPERQERESALIANPASVHCLRAGGELTIVRRGDGGEYGICTFPGGGQCEEWALFRGACPVGGVHVDAQAGPASRYCAITGGALLPGVGSGGADCEARCRLPEGQICPVCAYLEGQCPSR